ncbi:hypothetical protein [Endozoicomonas sp. Mp262]|uniref:hypothetical protein n=1 Tax=Endozoicomonas sp. Mp262 TaxID=2919499 RepID=UPI0021DA90CB
MLTTKKETGIEKIPFDNIFSDINHYWFTQNIYDATSKLFRHIPHVSGLLFEQHENHNQPCDVSIRLSDTDHSTDYFINSIRHTPLIKSCVWQQLVHFFLSGKDTIEDYWLEFDAPDLEKSTPVPSVFISPKKRSSEINPAPLFLTLNNLPTERLPASSIRLVNNILSDFPLVKLHYLGLMLPRQEKSLRCCFQLPFIHLKSFINNHKIPLTDAQIEQATNIKLGKCVSDIVVSLDLADTVKPRIGIEYPVSNKQCLKPLYKILMDQESGIHDDYTHWSKDSPELKPALSQGTVSTLPDTHKKLVYSRRINHLKLVFEPGKAPEIKTYLYLALGWYNAYREASIVIK